MNPSVHADPSTPGRISACENCIKTSAAVDTENADSQLIFITHEEVMEVILSLEQDLVRFSTVQNLLRNRRGQRLLVAEEKVGRYMIVLMIS